MTELQAFKDMIEDGASIVEACENVDIDQMVAEGDSKLAAAVTAFMDLAEELCITVGVE